MNRTNQLDGPGKARRAMRGGPNRRTVMRLGGAVVAVLVVIGVAPPGLWACSDCFEGGTAVPCSLCSACFMIDGFSSEEESLISFDTGDKLRKDNVRFEGPHWRECYSEHVICVHCSQTTSESGESEDLILEFTKPSANKNDTVGTYTPVGRLLGSRSFVEHAASGKSKLHCANGWDVQEGSIIIRDETGREVENRTLNGTVITGLQRGDNLYTRTYEMHDWDYDGVAEDYATLITHKRDDSGTDVVIEKTYFEYVTSGTVLARKRVTVERYNSDGTKRFLTTIHAYYDSGDFQGKIKFIVPPEGVKRYLTANLAHGIDPDDPGAPCGLDNRTTVPDDALDDYAEVTYDAYWKQGDPGYTAFQAGKIKQITRHGDCCGGSGASGQYSFAYGENANYPETPSSQQEWNTWKTYLRTTYPSGLRVVNFYNTHGQVIFRVVQEMDGNTILKRWVTHNKRYYNDAYRIGLIAERRYPSACANAQYSFPDADGDQQPDTDGWTEDVSPFDTGTDGLVHVYDYHDPSREIASEKVRKGTGGTEYWVRMYTYLSQTWGTGNPTIYLLDKVYVYPTEQTSEVPSPDDRQVTDHDYTFYDDSNAVEFKTVKYEDVPTTKNGSGNHTYVEYHYERDTVNDLYWNDWTEHEDGTYSYTELGTGAWDFGQVVKSVQDVDDTAGLTPPSGWDPPGSGHLNLTTTYAYEGVVDAENDLGSTRLKSVTIDPDGDCERKTVYAYECQRKTESDKETTLALVTLVTPHMDANGNYNYAPVRIAVTDLAGRTIVSAAGMPDTPTDGNTENTNLLNDWDATGTIDDDFTAWDDDGDGVLTARTVSNYNDQGQLTSVVRWTDADDSNDDKYTTTYTYNTTTGQRYMVESPDGTFTWTKYCQLGRVVETWLGTDDTNVTATNPGNLSKISATFYDEWDENEDPEPGSGTSGVGDGNVTQTKTYYDAGNSYDTVYNYDYRNRLTKTRGPDSVATVRTLDNLGRVKETKTHANSTLDGNGVITVTDANLRAKSETNYDEKGQVYQTIVHEVDPDDGDVHDHLTTNYWYDARGRLIKTKDPNGLFTKTKYDGTGRAIASYVSYDSGEGDTEYTKADDVDNDTVAEQTKRHYDNAGNVWLTRGFQRHDNATGTGELNDPGGNQPKARVTYAAAWFDELGRTEATIYYGTNDDTVIEDEDDDFDPETTGTQGYDHASMPLSPNTSDNYVVAKYVYDSAGRLSETYDNKDTETRREYNDLGRVTKTIENYSDGSVGNSEYDSDRTTEYEFDTSGRLVTLIAHNPKGSSVEQQKTRYLHGSALNGSWVTAVVYPDSGNGLSQNETTKVWSITSGSDHVAVTYDRLGRKVTFTDQRGTVHTYVYRTSDGRLEKDRVTNLGGVDNYVQSVKYEYDDLGRRQSVTCYSGNNTDGTVRNGVKVTYGAWGHVTKSEQDHAGAAGSGDPAVQYVYDDGASGGDAKYVRLDTVDYPNDRVVYYHYANTTTSANWTDQEKIGQKLSRLRTIAKADIGAGALADSNKHAQYTYLGAGTVVKVAHPAVTNGLDLTYGTGGAYPGFDRFGRILWQKWTSGSTWKDAYWYGYDRAGNRLWRGERQDRGIGGNRRDEAYEYDGLDRLKRARRGTLLAGAPVGGDADKNGVINSNDFDDFDNGFILGGDTWEEGDFDGDGDVDKNLEEAWDDGDIIDANFGEQPSYSVSHTWQWTLDAVGNWTEYKYDAGDGSSWDLDQDRAHNEANEIDGNSGNPLYGTPNWVDPDHDAAGNMLFVPRPGQETTANKALHLVYDAWNRLVEVWEDTNEDGDLDAEGTDTQILECRYDGLGRRIAKTDKTGESDVTYDYYYNTSWQVLEVRKGGDTDPLDQYVWDIRYIDAPVLRWRDGNTDGDLDGGTQEGDNTLYYTNDANMNVTALVDESDGAVVERTMYDPYGKVSVRHGVRDSGGNDTSGSEWDERTSDTFDNAIRYCGYFFDNESGLYHVRHRMYHPTLGRWVQRDRTGYADGMSLFQYVGSAPNTWSDPFGTDRSILRKAWDWLTDKQYCCGTKVFDPDTECCADKKKSEVLPEVPSSQVTGFEIAGRKSRGEVLDWVYENNMSHADMYHHGVLIRVGQFDLAGDYDRDNTRTDDLSRGFERFPLSRIDRGTLEYGSRAGLECRCATEQMIKDCVWAVPKPPQDKAYNPAFNNCQQDLQRAADACCLAGFFAAPWRVWPMRFRFGSPFYGSGPFP